MLANAQAERDDQDCTAALFSAARSDDIDVLMGLIARGERSLSFGLMQLGECVPTVDARRFG
jgi:hypothetical protein